MLLKRRRDWGNFLLQNSPIKSIIRFQERVRHRGLLTSVRNRCAAESEHGAALCHRGPLQAYSCRQWNKLIFYFLLDHRYDQLFSLEVSQEFLEQMHHFAHLSDKMSLSVLCLSFPSFFIFCPFHPLLSLQVLTAQAGISDDPLVTDSMSCFSANLPPTGRAHLASPFLDSQHLT